MYPRHQIRIIPAYGSLDLDTQHITVTFNHKISPSNTNLPDPTNYYGASLPLCNVSEVTVVVLIPPKETSTFLSSPLVASNYTTFKPIPIQRRSAPILSLVDRTHIQWRKCFCGI